MAHQNLLVIRPWESMNSLYLASLLTSQWFRPHMADISQPINFSDESNGQMKLITLNNLKSLMVPVPPLDDQQAIADAFVEHERLVRESQQRADATLRRTLETRSNKQRPAL